MASLDQSSAALGFSGVTPQQSHEDATPRCICGQPSAPKGRFCSRRCKDRAYNLAHPVARQRPLPFAPPTQPVPQVVDNRPDLAECEKLKGDNALVLARLRQGAATTRELAEAAPRSMAIHSRISDIRAHLKPLGETVTRWRMGPRLHRYVIEEIR